MDSMEMLPSARRGEERSSFVYDLFISYRRKDGTPFANWLRRRLVTYKPPSSLRQRRDVRIRVYQDIAYERATEDFWRNSIEPALKHSRYLCVVATRGVFEKNDGGPDWVAREISTFLKTRQKKNVFVIGAHNRAALPRELAAAYPNIEQLDLSALGSAWRRTRRGSQLEHALLAIVAALLDIAPEEMPILRQEEKRRRRRRTFAASAALSVLLAVMAVLTIVWLGQRARAESRALAAQAESVFSRDQPRALDLAIRAWKTDRTAEAHAAVAHAFPQLVATLAGHSDVITHAALSPDNQRLLTRTKDGKVWVWDIRGERLIATLQVTQYGGIAQAEFLPNGEDILLIDGDCNLQIWNAASHQISETGEHRKCYSEWYRQPTFSSAGEYVVGSDLERVTHLWSRSREIVLDTGGELGDSVFSADGRRLLTRGSDRNKDNQATRVWDTSNGRLLGTYESDPRFAFSRDGRRFASLDWGHQRDTKAIVWDIATGKRLLIDGQPWPNRDDYYAHDPGPVVFSPDGERILAALGDVAPRIWSAGDGKLLATLNATIGPLTAALFAPDGRHAVTAGMDSTVRLWDAGSGQWLGTLSGHKDVVTTLAFSSDGRWLVTAGKDKTARVWNIFNNSRFVAPLDESEYRAVFSSDSRLVMTVSSDGFARVWNTADGKPVGQFGQTDDQGPDVGKWASFSPDGKLVAHTGEDNDGGTGEIWSISTGKRVLTLRTHFYAVNHVAYSPDGERFVTAGGDKTARIWNAHTGQLLATLSGHTAPLIAAEFSRDGKRILSGSTDNTGRVWDASDGHLLLTLTNPNEDHSRHLVGADRVIRVISSPDGSRIATLDLHGTNLFDGSTGDLISAWHGAWPAFSNDGKRIFVAGSVETEPGRFSGGGWWQASDGRLLSKLPDVGDIFTEAVLSADRAWIATGEDARTRIWDSSDGRLMITLPGTTRAGISTMRKDGAFSPDGHYLATYSLDHTGSLYRLVTVADVSALLEEK